MGGNLVDGNWMGGNLMGGTLSCEGNRFDGNLSCGEDSFVLLVGNKSLVLGGIYKKLKSV